MSEKKRKRKPETQSKKRRKKSKSESGGFFEEEEDVISFYTLPPEIIVQILTAGRVDAETLEALRRTNKQLYSIITDPTSKKIICRELRESLSRLKTPEGILGWLRRHQMTWEIEQDDESMLFFKEIDGSFGTLLYGHFHPHNLDPQGGFRVFISTLYKKSYQMIPAYQQEDKVAYETYDVPADIRPSEMTIDHIMSRTEYKKARLTVDKQMKPILQEMLDRGVRFGTGLIQRKPETDEAFREHLYFPGLPAFWFVPSVNNKNDYMLYAKGSHLQDDSAHDHPYCRDLID